MGEIYSLHNSDRVCEHPEKIKTTIIMNWTLVHFVMDGKQVVDL